MDPEDAADALQRLISHQIINLLPPDRVDEAMGALVLLFEIDHAQQAARETRAKSAEQVIGWLAD